MKQSEAGVPARLDNNANVTTRSEFFDVGYAPRVSNRQAPLVLIHQQYQEGDDTGNHRHEDFYALYLVRSGRALKVIDGHPHPTGRGDVYITQPGSVHAYRQYQGLQAEAFCFQAAFFSVPELEALRSLPGFRNLFVPQGLGAKEVFEHSRFHLNPEQLAQAEEMVRSIQTELAASANDVVVAPLLVRQLFFQLLVFLARTIPAEANRTNNEPLHGMRGLKLNEIVRLCETQFHEKLQVPQLACLMHFSVSRFNEVFKDETGMSPAAYIRSLRLQHAQKLLRTTQLPVALVAQQSGFSDSAELARVFQRELHLSPSRYRASFSTKSKKTT